MRWDEGATIASARASAKCGFRFVTTAVTRSPGSAPSTKRTKPSTRVIPRPPKARSSTVSSTVSPFLKGRAEAGFESGDVVGGKVSIRLVYTTVARAVEGQKPLGEREVVADTTGDETA